MKKEQLAFNFW